MRDKRDLITAEDLLVIFSEVTLAYKKRIKKSVAKDTTTKISLKELMEIFEEAAKRLKK